MEEELNQQQQEETKKKKNILLAITGASGVIYGYRLLEELLRHEQNVWLIFSDAAKYKLKEELNWLLPEDGRECLDMIEQSFDCIPGQIKLFGYKEWDGLPVSGSTSPDSMVICPASMGTCAAIRHGLSTNLIERGAEVVLKEKKELIIVPRESPLSTIHLENLTYLSRMGAMIMPASPGFYHFPATINDLVDFIVQRILNQLGICELNYHKHGFRT